MEVNLLQDHQTQLIHLEEFHKYLFLEIWPILIIFYLAKINWQFLVNLVLYILKELNLILLKLSYSEQYQKLLRVVNLMQYAFNFSLIFLKSQTMFLPITSISCKKQLTGLRFFLESTIIWYFYSSVTSGPRKSSLIISVASKSIADLAIFKFKYLF